MKTRKLGKTGIEVSELVLGGGYVGGILLQPDEKEKLRAVQYAMDCGINLIDTAPSYGNGESEKAVGKLLPQLTPRPYLATKVQIDPLIREDLAGQVEKSITASLTRLETSSVDSPLDQSYVYNPEPPVTVTSIEPSLAPLHETP